MWKSKKHRLYSVLALACILNSCHAECQPGQDSEDACIKVSSTSPVTLGMSLWFSVDVINYDLAAEETLYFSFVDGLFYNNEVEESTLHYTWNVTYDYAIFKPFTGRRSAQFTVYKKSFLLWRVLDSASLEFFLAENVRGGIVITQQASPPPHTDLGLFRRSPHHTEIRTRYISTATSVNLTASVHDPHNYMFNHSSVIFFYWMINQETVGTCSTPSFIYNITKPGKYLIEANVVVTLGEHVTPNTTTTTTPAPANASHQEFYHDSLDKQSAETSDVSLNFLTLNSGQSNFGISSAHDVSDSSNLQDSKNKTTTTSTTTTTTSTTTTTTTAKPTPPHPVPPPTPTPTPDGFMCDGHWPGGDGMHYPSAGAGGRSLASSGIHWAPVVGSTPEPDNGNSSTRIKKLLEASDDLTYTSDIISPKYRFGTFSRAVIAKDPIVNVNVSGNTWLKFGELTNLTVTCDGTGDWSYCWEYVEGIYNATGNETCDDATSLQHKCHFNILYLLASDPTYTFIIIIDNGVTRAVTPIAVNIYKKQPPRQLFRVLMPVATACLIFAFTVFAIGFYIRKRRNYIVEVADFDFVGSTSADIGDGMAGVSVLAHIVWAVKKAYAERTNADDDNYRRNPRYVERPTILDEED